MAFYHHPNPPLQRGGDFRSGGFRALPEVGAQVGVSFGPGDEDEDHFAGVGVGPVVPAAQEVAHQFPAFTHAVAGLCHAVREHHADTLYVAPAGALGGRSFVELVADFHGQVPDSEDGEDGFKLAPEGVHLAAEVAMEYIFIPLLMMMEGSGFYFPVISSHFLSFSFGGGPSAGSGWEGFDRVSGLFWG